MKVESTQQITQQLVPYTDKQAVKKYSKTTWLPQQTIRNWRNGFCEASLDKLLCLVDAAGYQLTLEKKDD